MLEILYSTNKLHLQNRSCQLTHQTITQQLALNGQPQEDGYKHKKAERLNYLEGESVHNDQM